MLLYSTFGVFCFIFFFEFNSVRRDYNDSIKSSIEQRHFPAVVQSSNGSLLQNQHNVFKDAQGQLGTPVKVTHLNATTAIPTISLSTLLEPKNWKRDGYKSVRENEVIQHCKKCAIVTSSGHLLGTKAGPEIDSTECVIRMNAAPTVKYEADVGQRTTFRIVGHRNFPRMFDSEPERQSYFVNPKTKSDAIVTAWLYAVNVGRNIETFLSKKYSKKYKDVKFFITSEEQMIRNEKLFYQMLGIKKPKKQLWMSTGWTTMIFALEVCDDIHVYGMTYEEYCKEHPSDRTYYHYFDKLRRACDYFKISENRITTGHKFLTEKLAFANWASLYNITFHYPSWKNHTSSRVSWESPFHKTFLKFQNNTKKADNG